MPRGMDMGSITIIGTGLNAGQLTLDAVEALQSGARVLLHTGRCACAAWLDERGIAFETLDELYESCEDFDEHALAAAQAVIAAAEGGPVLYGVFDVRDRSVPIVKRLASQSGIAVSVIAGPPVEGALWAEDAPRMICLEASAWEEYRLTSAVSALIREIDTRQLAGEVKLRLMDVYPEDSPTLVLKGDGAIARIRLYELDRLAEYDHRTCALIPACAPLQALERFTFDRFCEIIQRLIAPDGCPWDRAQTHRTLRSYLVEEAWETVGAIDEDDPWHLCDELGDVLLQVVLHAAIAARHGEFDIGDVVTAISKKMISRHTHVFGKDHVDSAQEVGQIWTRNKMRERGQTSYTETLRDVSKSYPATMRAGKVLKRAEAALRQKTEPGEALNALRAAADAALRPDATPDADELRVGRIAMAWVEYARSLGVDPEIAVGGAVERLIGQFGEAEERLSAQGRGMDALTDDEAREYWHLVKLRSERADMQETGPCIS